MYYASNASMKCINLPHQYATYIALESCHYFPCWILHYAVVMEQLILYNAHFEINHFIKFYNNFVKFLLVEVRVVRHSLSA